MSYIHTIAWGMLEPDELELDERQQVLEKLHYELSLHGFMMSHWPMSPPRKKAGLGSYRGPPEFVVVHRSSSIRYQDTLRGCCRHALALCEIEPPNHDTPGGNDADL